MTDAQFLAALPTRPQHGALCGGAVDPALLATRGPGRGTDRIDPAGAVVAHATRPGRCFPFAAWIAAAILLGLVAVLALTTFLDAATIARGAVSVTMFAGAVGLMVTVARDTIREW